MNNEEWGQEKCEYIEEFPLDQIKRSEVIHIIGRPGSGKTHLELFLAYAKKHIYPVASIVCGTEDTQHAFSPCFGGAFVSSTYNEYNHKKLFMRQKLCVAEGCKGLDLISIIDDIGYDKKASKSESIVQAHKNGSQWFNELLIMGYQSIKDIPEELLNSPSKVFIFMETEDSNRRKIHRAYFKTMIPEYADFSKLMNDICVDFTCLVVDLKSQSGKLADTVYAFKAPGWNWKGDTKLHPYPEGWRFGCAQFKEWSDIRHDPNAIPDFIADLNKF